MDITVTPVDDTPVASDDTATTAEDTQIIINVLANDTDVDGDVLTVKQIDGQDVTVGVPVPVEHGTATLNADGTITFTPEANYNGPATFQLHHQRWTHTGNSRCQRDGHAGQ